MVDQELVYKKIYKNSIGTGCWNWAGNTNQRGYGCYFKQYKTKRRTFLAHRLVWTLLRGPIPDGLVIDHLCRNLCCVNPDHLEPVTVRENSIRGWGASFISYRKGKCFKGHDVSGENIIMIKESGAYVSRCRICRMARIKKSNSKKYKNPLGPCSARRYRQLTADDVRSIRSEYDGSNVRELAIKYDRHQNQITRVINRTAWKHVPDLVLT